MKESVQTSIARSSRVDPPEGLFAAVMMRLERERRRAARIRVFVFGATSVVSFFAMIPSLVQVESALSRSGFMEYLSLLFSDGGSVLGYWKEFAMSLVESMPLADITVLAVISLVLLGSLRGAIGYSGTAFLSTKFA